MLRATPELATLQARNRKEAGYYTNDEVILLLDRLETLPGEKLYLRIGIMLTLFTGIGRGGSKLFKAFQEDSGLRVITFHQPRHTHASLLRYLNVDEMQISRRLGHSDLSTTRNIYTHLFANTDQSVSEKISETFLKNKATKIGFTPNLHQSVSKNVKTTGSSVVLGVDNVK